MEKQLTAILLKATDVRESDRSVRLFSAEEGVVSAKMRGVRKAAAKLKFAAQPFSFCTYELTGKGNTLTVTGAAPIEDLYALTSDPERYAAGCVMLELVDKAAPSLSSSQLFIVLLKALKSLICDPAESVLILTKFIQKVLSMSGFMQNPEKKDVYSDTVGGLLDAMAYLPLSELHTLTYTHRNAVTALKRIAERFTLVYECKLPSLSVYTAMLK